MAYIPTNWQTGDIVSSERLNKLEKGVEDASVKIDAIEEELGGGGLEDLSVGTADQLLADTGITDKVPYVFRASDHNSTRLTDKIVGGTIVWNQVIQNGNFASTSNWGTPTGFSVADNIATLTPTTSGDNYAEQNISLVPNHKYLYSVYAKADNNDSTKAVLRIYYGSVSDTFARSVFDSNWNILAGMFIAASGTLNRFRLFNGVGDTSNHWKNVQIFDLTQMFGSAVADQIYALEQATAGAGVALFKSLFPKDYYAYNTGELMSVNTSAHVTTGFNQWDEDWELYGTDQMRGKNPVAVKQGVTYYGKCPSSVTLSLFFKETPTGASIQTINAKNSTFVVPNGAKYMMVYTTGGYGTTYNHDICINLSDPAKNGTYEPYIKRSYPLDSSLTLRGVPKLDANNNIYYDGDTYEADGKVTRRYGVLDLGSLSGWSVEFAESGQFMLNNINNANPNIAPMKYNGLLCCAKFKGAQDRSYASILNGEISATNSIANVILRAKDTAYANMTVEQFTAAMSGVYLVYELATPTTETADPYTNPQILDPNGTEEYVDASAVAGTRDVAVPVGHETLYHEDLKGKIEGLPKDFSGIIAPTEAGFKATRAYTANDLIIINNVLYRVTASISNGGAITVGTNVTATTLAELLKSLIS